MVFAEGGQLPRFFVFYFGVLAAGVSSV